jgi:protein-L-isoaspartate O-methyltransferase
MEGPFTGPSTDIQDVLVKGPAVFDDLIAEGESEPVEGWDFSWFEGRATEERPSWGYTQMLVPRVSAAQGVLDIQTGGGEVLAGVLAQVPEMPKTVAATESWVPNARIARRNLAPFGVSVVEVADDADIPFPADHFDLVISRHPTITIWNEIARVLSRGGTYFSQQVGAGSNRELTDFIMGPQPVSERRSAQRAVEQAQNAGLHVVDLRQESLRTVFNDVGAIVYFLRKVYWTVPGFTVDKYGDRLSSLHEKINRDGPFVAHSQRFLIEARKQHR